MLKKLFTQRALFYCGKDLLVKQQYDHSVGVQLMSSFNNKFYWKPKREKANPRPKLPVILLEDDENLGRKYEVVKVERGYARHVLIPEGKADYAIKENLETYGCNDNVAKARASLKFLNKLKSMTLVMQRPKDETWEISKHHIALAFQKNFKLHVPVHCLRTDFESISSYGNFEVHVTVNGESSVPVKISVQEWEPVYKKGWKEALLEEIEEDVESND